MTTDPVIEMQDVVAAYNGAAALTGVSLCVHAGECVALAGANGAGKTTLLTAVNGFAPLVSGTVRVLGMKPHGRNAVRVRRRVGYVAQTAPLDRRMPITLMESVMTGVYGRLGWRQRPSQDERTRVLAMLEELQLSHLSERPLGHLSGGETRRAMIARCLAQQPEIMLLDEPTASLDKTSCAIIMNVMERTHCTAGTTILWVTHDLDALPPGCARLLRMQNGAIVADTGWPPA